MYFVTDIGLATHNLAPFLPMELLTLLATIAHLLALCTKLKINVGIAFNCLALATNP